MLNEVYVPRAKAKLGQSPRLSINECYEWVTSLESDWLWQLVRMVDARILSCFYWLDQFFYILMRTGHDRKVFGVQVLIGVRPQRIL